MKKENSHYELKVSNNALQKIKSLLSRKCDRIFRLNDCWEFEFGFFWGGAVARVICKGAVWTFITDPNIRYIIWVLVKGRKKTLHWRNKVWKFCKRTVRQCNIYFSSIVLQYCSYYYFVVHFYYLLQEINQKTINPKPVQASVLCDKKVSLKLMFKLGKKYVDKNDNLILCTWGSWLNI